jgi:hypothetical protein
VNYSTGVTNTTLPINNLNVNKEASLGNKFAWDENVLEPLSN